MEEEKTLATEKPKKTTLWDGALKMVKGENTNQLIEQFTAEMTLVAEGLCEDQTKDLTELRSRLSPLEKQAAKPQVKEKKKATSVIRDLTWLVGIAAAAWVIVTIINAIK